VSFLARYPSHTVVAAACLGVISALVVQASATPLAVLGGSLAVAACVTGPRRLLPAVAAAGVLGAWWGGIRLDALDRSVLRAHIGETAPADVVVTGPARRTAFSVRVPARVERFDRRAVRERILLELPVGRAPPQGGRLELVLELREPRPPEDGFSERDWLERQGVHVVGRGGRWRLVGRRGGLAGGADRLRAVLVGSIAPGLTGERAAVVAGIVLGEDQGLPDELADAFRASGLYHLLAVSGSNVGVVVGAAIGGATAVGLSRRVGHVLALVAILGYVAAVGWQPSVVRAGVAATLVSLAWLLARPRDRWHVLLVGATVLLAWNPRTLLEPGFQLSFAAVLAIFLVVPPALRVAEGYPIPAGLAVVVAVSGACSVVTAPISWAHFGAVPVWSVPANLLAWPVAGAILGLGLAAAALDPLVPQAAESVAGVNGWLAAYLAAVARLVASLPLAQLRSGLALLVLALLLGGIVAAVRGPSRLRLPVLASAAVAIAAVGFWHLGPRGGAASPPDGLRVTALDVGQGDAILVEAPGAAMLVDEGPPEAHAAEQLRRRGIRRLSLLVLTHPERDHVGGALEVIRRLDVGLLLDPGQRATSPYRDDAIAEARRRGVRVEIARAGEALRVGPLRVRVLWPEDAGVPGDNPNRRAIVLLVSYGSADILLTADAESDVTVPLRPPPVEILKVAHHGSADTRLDELLRLVRPRIALVSVGADNSYGHPAPSTLAALRATPGLTVLRTDRSGSVTVESDGRSLLVREER
jgi:competence protein ComEC